MRMTLKRRREPKHPNDSSRRGGAVWAASDPQQTKLPPHHTPRRYSLGMTYDDVTHDQALTLARWLTPTLRKLLALRERMEARGFPKDDPMYVKAAAAYEAVRQLRLCVRSKEPIQGVPDVRSKPPGGYPKY
jgi:hypothetical protein